jgi:2-C-methyl-D-erythritol 4-phosphate cytidylyltransferase/2-C-methyl-D-erythritol 2,4-cyclodiphosphate synthase
VVAAGRGERFGAAVAKPFLPLNGAPILVHAVRAVEASPLVDRVVVVVAASDVSQAQDLLAAHGCHKVTAVVPGGAERQASVQAGLAYVGSVDAVVVHDGVRPLATPETVTAVVRAALESGAASAGIPVRETVKYVTGDVVTATVDRTHIWIAHTPQAFRTDVLRTAHERALEDGTHARDDAALVERLGQTVRIIEDSPLNLKITVPEDLVLARAYLQQGAAVAVRTGLVFDAHRFASGRRLILGGVEIPAAEGLLGHSDADVLTHAIMDALLGAAGLGDIGEHFPPDDPQYANADSLQLLRTVQTLVASAGWRLVHVDTVILAERPRIGPHVKAIRERLAGVLGVPPSAVSIKATTFEGMGAVGRGEGIAAQAIATVEARQ